jgi:high-affinity nickel-transport protein
VTRSDKISVMWMSGFVLFLNVLGWGALFLVIAPQRLDLGSQGVFGVGLGVTAFLLGVRHAVDADHIAAIDNTARKLVGEDRPALGVGFWFSLGHSSVVFGLSFLLALGLRAVVGPVQDADSTLQSTLSLVGMTVAGVFLILIGLMNLNAVRGIVAIYREMKTGHFDEERLEQHLNARGFLARILSGLTKRVTKPWHLYPVGFLMGLGFDTATQVALLILAGGTAASALPWYAILVLPVLFAAGMALFDTADGIFMAHAYKWAFLKPIRKVYYNLTVTLLSVVVALGIGSVVLVQLAADRFAIESGLIGWVGALDLEFVGFALVGVFVLVWGASASYWRLARVEERWAAAAD